MVPKRFLMSFIPFYYCYKETKIPDNQVQPFLHVCWQQKTDFGIICPLNKVFSDIFAIGLFNTTHKAMQA